MFDVNLNVKLLNSPRFSLFVHSVQYPVTRLDRVPSHRLLPSPGEQETWRPLHRPFLRQVRWELPLCWQSCEMHSYWTLVPTGWKPSGSSSPGSPPGGDAAWASYLEESMKVFITLDRHHSEEQSSRNKRFHLKSDCRLGCYLSIRSGLNTVCRTSSETLGRRQAGEEKKGLVDQKKKTICDEPGLLPQRACLLSWKKWSNQSAHCQS